MQNYNIILNEDFSWSTIENQTGHIISTFFFEDDAEDYTDFLNAGGGFDGWTPYFMMIETKKSRDINEIFDAEFS